jgi:hypothetical protein
VIKYTKINCFNSTLKLTHLGLVHQLFSNIPTGILMVKKGVFDCGGGGFMKLLDLN